MKLPANRLLLKLVSNERGALPLIVLLIVIGLLSFFVLSSAAPFKEGLLGALYPKPSSYAAENWAFEETFDVGAPTAPSQDLLSKRFDYVVTHRNHPANPYTWNPFPADHGTDCKAAADAGPISDTNPILQHSATTDHISNTEHPDQSFFICNNHMMSSMGNVDGYSVSAFYPRQEFDFSSGNGVLEWDVNLNEGARSWWEVMITPKENTQLGAAKSWLPISETYPKQSIILTWSNEARGIEIYGDKPSPDGQTFAGSDWRRWGDWIEKGDPALTDRRIRRKMRATFTQNKINWEIQKPDGTFDSFAVDIPAGLPTTRGLVFFKTHAYTPEKDGNMDRYTYHWDNIRFNGPVLTPYKSFEIPGLVLLNGNGSVPIGTTKTVSLNLSELGPNPVLLGQTQMGQPGQVLLSINGSPNIEVSPHSHSSKDAPCYYDGWRTFRFPINKDLLKVGENTFKWTVGPRPACAAGQWWWDGFAVKAFELQFDGDPNATPIPVPSATIKPSSSPVASVQPTATPVPTPMPTSVPTPVPTPMTSDTIAPVVSISAPENNTTVTRNANFTFSANATDNVRVAKVEFYVDGALKASDTSSPYALTTKIAGKPNAPHTLMVKAYDAANNVSSAAVIVRTK